MQFSTWKSLVTLLLTATFSLSLAAQEKIDPLPSWNDVANKKAIIEFVQAVTDKNSPAYAPVSQRIATFDNDGTMWVEQPMYTQITFALDRVKTLAPKNPAWKTTEPFKTVLEGDRTAMDKLPMKELLKVFAATDTGMTTQEYHQLAKDWLATAKHPRYNKLYTECIYQPMVEVMRYLRANGFRTFIVTGGDQIFVRAFADQAYGVPVDQVIGTAVRTKYEYRGNTPVMMRLPSLLFIDDGPGKPEDIELFLGAKPLAAFGNSTGDRQMLEWTQSGGGKRLMMLVHHDDAQREYAYGAQSRIGTFSDSLMAEAKERSWNVISMKNDWKRIFSFDEAGK